MFLEWSCLAKPFLCDASEEMCSWKWERPEEFQSLLLPQPFHHSGVLWVVCISRQVSMLWGVCISRWVCSGVCASAGRWLWSGVCSSLSLFWGHVAVYRVSCWQLVGRDQTWTAKYPREAHSRVLLQGDANATETLEDPGKPTGAPELCIGSPFSENPHTSCLPLLQDAWWPFSNSCSYDRACLLFRPASLGSLSLA